MKETVFIRLGADSEAPQRYVLHTPQGGVQARSGLLAQIAEAAAGRDVVAFVPAAHVRLASVLVPARAPQKALQAAPYLLEEQLAEDVETLHFALGPRQADGRYPVAIASRARMDGWLAQLAAAGLQPTALVPEMLALPWSDDRRLHALADAGGIVVRNGAWEGFSSSAADLPMLLQIADPDARYGLRVFVTPEAREDYTTLGRSVELLPGHAGAIDVLARQYRPEQAINLLQGSYSRRDRLRRVWAPWRLPVGLAAAWVLVSLLATGLDAWRLHRAADAQHQRNVARYQQLFPAEQRIVDLAAQADAQLRAIQTGGGSNRLLQLLQPVAYSMTAVPGLKLESLQFREGSLYLNLSAADLQALDKLRAWYAEHPGTALEVESANAAGGAAQIRLKLTPA